MTTKDFFDAFSDFLSQDEDTAQFTGTFKNTLMDQGKADYQNKFFTRTGFRVALIFFDLYGEKHEEFKSPECLRGFIDWKNKDIEKIKSKLAQEYDTVMYVGKENCDEGCNFVIFDPSAVVAADLVGGIDAFVNLLEQ